MLRLMLVHGSTDTTIEALGRIPQGNANRYTKMVEVEFGLRFYDLGGVFTYDSGT